MRTFDQLAGLTEDATLDEGMAPYVDWRKAKNIPGGMVGSHDQVQKASGGVALHMDYLAGAIAHYNKGAGPGTAAQIKRAWGHLADELEALATASKKAAKNARSFAAATGI